MLGAVAFQRAQIFTVWHDLQMIAHPSHTNHLLDVGVIETQLLISQRPILLDALGAPFPEIAVRKAQADGIPMNAPPSDGPNPINRNPIAVFVTNGLSNLAG